MLEVHKTTTGQIYVLGYLSAGDIATLETAKANGVVVLSLYMSPTEELTQPVAIPVERIRLAAEHSLSRAGGRVYVIDLELTMVVDDVPLVVPAAPATE